MAIITYCDGKGQTSDNEGASSWIVLPHVLTCFKTESDVTYSAQVQALFG